MATFEFNPSVGNPIKIWQNTTMGDTNRRTVSVIKANGRGHQIGTVNRSGWCFVDEPYHERIKEFESDILDYLEIEFGARPSVLDFQQNNAANPYKSIQNSRYFNHV